MSFFFRLVATLLVVQLAACGSSEIFMDARRGAYVEPTETYPRVTWFGVTTILIDDGVTQVLIDGFFSRPRQAPLFPVSPDPLLADQSLLGAFGLRPASCRAQRFAETGCPFADRTGLRLVIPAHAHYDHVLDAPLVSAVAGAPLFPGPSVKPVVQATQEMFGSRIPQIQLLDDMSIGQLLSSDGLKVGSMTIRLIETPHVDTPVSNWTDGTTADDFSFPAFPGVMKEGENYAIWLETDGHRILIIPSGGHLDGRLSSRNIQADTVFLGIGYVGRHNDQEFSDFWEEAVVSTNARSVVLVHWDDMRGMLDPEELPQDLKPWDLFRLDRTYMRIEAEMIGSDVSMIHPMPGVPFGL